MPAARVAHGLINLAQKIAGNRAVLTEVWVRLGRRSGSTASSPAAGRVRSFAVRTVQDFPGFLGFTCGRAMSLRSKIWGQLGSIHISGEKSRWRSDLTSGRRKAGVRTACSGSGCAGRGRVGCREGSRGQLKKEAVNLGAGRWQALR